MALCHVVNMLYTRITLSKYSDTISCYSGIGLINMYSPICVLNSVPARAPLLYNAWPLGS